jgi:peroxiredoxin
VQLGQLQKAEQALRELGFELVAASADRPAKLRESLREHDLSYTLLSDARMHGARAFGIAFRVDDATRERYRSLGIDLEAASGEDHHLLPVPSVFLIDREGRIGFAYSNADYTTRLPTADLLDAARHLAES